MDPRLLSSDRERFEQLGPLCCFQAQNESQSRLGSLGAEGSEGRTKRQKTDCLHTLGKSEETTTNTRTQTDTHTQRNIHTHKHTHPRIHTREQIHIHDNTHTHKNRHTHKNTHTRTDTHKPEDTHTHAAPAATTCLSNSHSFFKIKAGYFLDT
ncbi:unnamed protein product [Gadus morhua 'NCC']